MTTNRHTTKITASGTGDSPDTWSCPSVHTLPDREEAYVVIRDDADDAARAELAEHVGPGEVLGTVPPWIPCGLMDLPTLGAFMDAHLTAAGHQVCRMEVADHFEVGDDFERWQTGGQPDYQRKQAWLDRLRADEAAGIRHVRVRMLSRDLSPYELYACQWGHAPNADHEDIYVLREGEHEIPAGLMRCEYWLVNDAIAVPTMYDGNGAFIGAGHLDAERSAPFLADWRRALKAAEPWASWWARHPELHDQRGRLVA